MHIIKKLKITISSIHSCITIKKMENSKENKKYIFMQVFSKEQNQLVNTYLYIHKISYAFF